MLSPLVFYSPSFIALFFLIQFNFGLGKLIFEFLKSGNPVVFLDHAELLNFFLDDRVVSLCFSFVAHEEIQEVLLEI